MNERVKEAGIAASFLLVVFLLLFVIEAKADISSQTVVETNGYTVYSSEINGQRIEIESDGKTKINSSYENGSTKLFLESDGNGKIETDVEGEYQIYKDGETENGSGVLKRIFEFIRGIVFRVSFKM